MESVIQLPISLGHAALLVSPVLVAASAATFLNPRTALAGPVHWRGSGRNGAKVALTFDDGPSDPSTARILDVLGELNVRATFFVVGRNAQQNPKLVERMRDEGHRVGNHSWDHHHLGMLRGPLYWAREIQRTDELLRSILGHRVAMFRPPMGVRTWVISYEARRFGHEVVTWSLRGMDGVATSEQQILDRLIPRARAGDIMLLHDGIEPYSRRDPQVSIKVVRPLISQLRDRGLEPAAVDEVLELPAYHPTIAAVR